MKKYLILFFGCLICGSQVHASLEPIYGELSAGILFSRFVPDIVSPPQKRVKREVDPSRSLYNAVRANNEQWVQTFISRNADLDEVGGKRSYDKRTPLYKAVLKGNKHIAALLLAAGADVNKQADFGSPLAWATANGDKEMVALLLKYHADQNQDDDCSPLYWAIWKRHKGIVRMLLAAGSNPNTLIDPGEGTSLHEAALIDNERKSRDITQILLAYGATIEVKDNNGRTPLDLAVELRPNAHELIPLLTFGQTFIKNLKISLTTFAMAMHSRCGEKSPLRPLGQDIVHKIFSYLKPSVCMYGGDEVVHLCTMK